MITAYEVSKNPGAVQAFDELREYFRSRSRRGQHVPLAEQRRLFAVRWRSLIAEMSAA